MLTPEEIAAKRCKCGSSDISPGCIKARSWICRRCNSARGVERTRQNRESHNAHQRAYRAKNPGKTTQYCKRWREKNPETARANDRRQKLKEYGLTLTAYNAMAAAQGGVCGICKRPEPTGVEMPVDHDHLTGKVRGLLCSGCNPALGLFQDSPALLRAAADYLERHSYAGVENVNDTPESAMK